MTDHAAALATMREVDVRMTDHAAALATMREDAERVVAAHGYGDCDCLTYPCEALHMATRLLVALDALEFYGDRKNWKGGMPGYQHFEPDTHFGPEVAYWRADMGDRARAAIARSLGKPVETDDAGG